MSTLNEKLRCYRPVMDLFFPRACSLCDIPIFDPNCEAICKACFSKITTPEQRCVRCSAPLGPGIRETTGHATSNKTSCYYCERRKWSFRRAHCYTAYHGTAALAAKKIKQSSHEPLGIEIGKRIGEWLKQLDAFDSKVFACVIPVPQHWMRRIMVRYNQADILAERIALEIGLPVNRHSLYRTRWTEKQGTKSIADRLKDVRDSFACKPSKSIVGSRILLVDDVVTSGATANDAARALRLAGANRVEVVAFARGVGAFDKSRSNKDAGPTDSTNQS